MEGGALLALGQAMTPQALNLTWANEAMRKLENEMRIASQTDASVMLTGENGVGKQYAANMIHQLSRRRNAPFVAINAADVSKTTVHKEGQGPDTSVFLQAAEDGTLLIQDIENIPAPAQSQLLGFMDRTIAAKKPVRLMTATTTHLFTLVQAGAFRDDLFYRLNVIRFRIPPLRERREDIPLMFRHYVSQYAGTDAPRLSNAARTRLMEYSWPGNITELTSVAKTVSSRALSDLVDLEHLPCPVVECSRNETGARAT
jgi:two-component system nitrogen regulation response regulator GlnG